MSPERESRPIIPESVQKSVSALHATFSPDTIPELFSWKYTDDCRFQVYMTESIHPFSDPKLPVVEYPNGCLNLPGKGWHDGAYLVDRMNRAYQSGNIGRMEEALLGLPAPLAVFLDEAVSTYKNHTTNRDRI